MTNTPHHITPTRAALLDTLDPVFRTAAYAVITACAKRGIHMLPYCAYRDALSQAALWRQSRTIETIQTTCRRLRWEKADAIADLIERAGPHSGRWATNALPGQSAHQWRIALDCVPIDADGNAVWSGADYAWTVYVEEAVRAGLVAGGQWKKRDWVHIEQAENIVPFSDLSGIARNWRKGGWHDRGIDQPAGRLGHDHRR